MRRTFRDNFYVRYGVAVGVSLLTLSLKFLIQTKISPELEREAPFMLALAAVMTSGWIGGMGPGIVTTGICGLFGGMLFMEKIPDWGQRTRLAVFLIEGCLISVLCQALLSARRKAERTSVETRNLQQQLLQITDGEQRRIGHDLHDGLGQHLTGIALMAKLLEQRMAARMDPGAADAKRIAALVNKSISWTRDLARGMAPVELEHEDGLAIAFRQLCSATSDLSGITCHYAPEAELRVGNAITALHLYRIAQEALNNAVKHSGATRVVLKAMVASQTINVVVEDNGRGFDLAIKGSFGMGLRIMQYRATMIGGTVEFKGTPGGGTTVTCRCPAEPSREESSNDPTVLSAVQSGSRPGLAGG